MSTAALEERNKDRISSSLNNAGKRWSGGQSRLHIHALFLQYPLPLHQFPVAELKHAAPSVLFAVEACPSVPARHNLSSIKSGTTDLSRPMLLLKFHSASKACARNAETRKQAIHYMQR